MPALLGLLGLTKLHHLRCALRDSEWIALHSFEFSLFLHVDKWHGKEGGGTADFEEWGHTEIPVRHAQAELPDTALPMGAKCIKSALMPAQESL